jgi:hypothetical protein
LWLALPAAAVLAFLIHRGTFFAVRYIITVLPAYLILLSLGILALPRWLGARGLKWPALGLLVVVGGLAAATFGLALEEQYNRQDFEDWRLAARFIGQNAGSDDAIIGVKAEPVMNWYYPSARVESGHFLDLETVRADAAKAGRSWVVLSLFSSDIDGQIKAWLSEQQAVRFDLDPRISVYYLGPGVARRQLLTEIQEFALPADHALYASLARENRRRPAVARRYYELAIAHAPDEETRAAYREALEGVEE